MTLPEQPPKHSVSVAAAIIDDQGRFLAIRRADNGQWEPPGGVLELDESIEEGLVREVAEETGLTSSRSRYRRLQEHAPRHRRTRVPLRHRRRHPSPDAEVREIAWLTPDELDRMSEAYRVRLLDALDSASPHIRAHDGSQLLHHRS